MSVSRLCECGCGRETGLATRARNGYEKGEPLRFIRGHIGKVNSRRTYDAKLKISSDGTTLKLCTRCKDHHPLSQFNLSASRSERHRAHCKCCERQQAREHYQNNPEPYLARAVIVREQNRMILGARMERIKTMYGCRICGEKELCCLDFHHHMKKRKNVGNATDTVAGFENEIAKCVILCSNCHRKAHAGIISITDDMLCNKNDGKQADAKIAHAGELIIPKII